MSPDALVIPVPVSADRRAERGFNQVELLFGDWSRQQGLEWDAGTLLRRRPTTPQWELDRTQRRENIKGAFFVNAPATVQDRHILLVDDIVTTGRTLEECAGVLRQGDVSAGDAAFLAAAYGGALGDCLAAAGDAQRMEVLRGAARFVGLGAAKDRFGLLAEATRIEGKTKREEAESFLADLAQLYAAALDGRAVPGLPALSRQDAARALPAVFEAQRRLRGGSAKLVSTLLALRIAPPAEA